MPERSEKEALLGAVARFLESEVRPVVTDPRLAFRLLIAANLNNIVAAELRAGDGAERAEMGRLRTLIPDLVVDENDPHRACAELNRALAERLRSGEAMGAERLTYIRANLKQTLRARLAVSNPRFDLRPDIA